MSKNKAFFLVIFPIFMIWVLIVANIPKVLLGYIYPVLAGFFIGCVLLILFQKITGEASIFTSKNEFIQQKLIANLSLLSFTQQVKINELMMKYCPDEMTQEQKERWEREQKPKFLEMIKDLSKAVDQTKTEIEIEQFQIKGK